MLRVANQVTCGLERIIQMEFTTNKLIRKEMYDSMFKQVVLPSRQLPQILRPQNLQIVYFGYYYTTCKIMPNRHINDNMSDTLKPLFTDTTIKSSHDMYMKYLDIVLQSIPKESWDKFTIYTNKLVGYLPMNQYDCIKFKQYHDEFHPKIQYNLRKDLHRLTNINNIINVFIDEMYE